MKPDLNKILSNYAKNFGVNQNTLLTYFKRFASRGIYFLELPTGAGKSLLISILAIIFSQYGYKVLVFCRTHNQIDEYLNRFHILRSLSNINVKVIPLLGKDFTCPYGDLYLPRASYYYCKQLKNGEQCIDYKALKKMSPDRFKSLYNSYSKISTIMEKIFYEGVCPYYTLISLANGSNVVLSSFHYLFNGLPIAIENPYKYIIFIDEAHNIFDYLIETGVKQLDVSSLNSFLRKMMPENLVIEELALRQLTKDQLLYLLKLVSSSFLNLYYQYLMKRERNLEQNIIYELSILENLFSSSVTDVKLDENKLYIFMKVNKSYFSNLINNSLSTIFASATLSPHKYFIRLLKSLDIKLTPKIITSPYLYDPISSSKVKLHINTKFSSRFPERSEDIIELISRFSLSLAIKSKKHTFLFVPSKQLRDKFENKIRLYTNFNQNYEDVHLIEDRYLYEQNLFSNLIRNYILLGVFTQRGVFSEGINIFRRLELRFNLIIYGLSIFPLSEAKNEYLKKVLKLKRRKDIYEAGYFMPALIFFVQSIGRFLNRNSNLDIYVFESRIKEFLDSNFLPNWFKNMLRKNHIIYFTNLFYEDYENIDNW